MASKVPATNHVVRAVAIALLAGAVWLAGSAAGRADRQPQPEPNPCVGPEARLLRCPDLVMRRPYGLYADTLTRARHVLLRAGNVIDSIGIGPAELHGVRTSRRYMRAYQRIYARNGGRIDVNTGAQLEFKFAHQHRYWWKFEDAARFELWRVDSGGRRTRRVRTGPKIAYCLRDLTQTRPGLRASPGRRIYPACSTDPDRRRARVGTSPGWADVYPPAYPEQWIDVTGLRGCFAYVHRADPKNGIYESNEDNNLAQAIVRLPFRDGNRRGGCPGRDRGRGFDPNRYY
jgi:Lysyl oxidase